MTAEFHLRRQNAAGSKRSLRGDPRARRVCAVLYCRWRRGMAEDPSAGIGQRVRLGFEAFLLERLVPKDHVGRGLRRLFRMPLFLQRIGLGIFLPRNVLILTTTGRRSGRPHATPVEFGPGPRAGSIMIMSGWDGHTDWYRN